MITLDKDYRVRKIDDTAIGLKSWLGHPPTMARPHRHSEIELNYVQSGAITYLHRDTYVPIKAGCLAAFWAAIPHQLVGGEAESIYYYLTIPLESFLHWKLPEPFTQALLAGKMVVEAESANAMYNNILFQQWHVDLETGHAALALLEIEARLWRLALTANLEGRASAAAQPLPLNEQASQMAKFIIAHYAEPLTVQSIANTVGLHPNYAMQVFKKAFQMSLGEYIIQYRIAQAQRLLATTDANVLDIALQTGFCSSSNFYVAFKKYCGQAPTIYRHTMHVGYQG